LSRRLLGAGVDQFVAVLEQQQPPRLVVGVGAAHHDVDEITRVGEQPLGVEHEVELAPGVPLAGQRPQSGGLARARWAVHEQHPARQLGTVENDELIDGRGRRR